MKILEKIGIIPNSVDFTHPQDRRRYVPTLSRLGVNYETASFDKQYDTLYISLLCDLNLWANYRIIHKDTRIIFDFSDNYLKDGLFRSMLRSAGHYFSGRTDTFEFDYRVSIQKILDIADIVCVSSVEQKIDIESRTKADVIIVRDSFEEFGPPVRICEKYNRSSNAVSICWEGFSHAIHPTVRFIKEFLLKLIQMHGMEINIYFVTDRKSCRYFGKYFCEEVEDILENEFSLCCNINARFLEWSVENLMFVARECDFAIIPIVGSEIAKTKPENKLLLFWYLGLPVISSAIPSYQRMTDKFGLGAYCCSSMEEWLYAATNLISRPNDYVEVSDYIYQYINENISTAKIDEKMKIVFGL